MKGEAMPTQSINLDLAAVPVREVRINSVTSYQGTAKDLISCTRQGPVRDGSRSFSQCLGCSTTKAACMTVLIQDGAVISHGPVGCSSCLSGYDFTYRVNAPLRGVKTPRRDIYIRPTSRRLTPSMGEGQSLLAQFGRSTSARVIHMRFLYSLPALRPSSETMWRAYAMRPSKK